MNRDRVRLLHIVDAIRRIRSYVSDHDTFQSESLVQDGVIRNLVFARGNAPTSSEAPVGGRQRFELLFAAGFLRDAAFLAAGLGCRGADCHIATVLPSGSPKIVNQPIPATSCFDL